MIVHHPLRGLEFLGGGRPRVRGLTRGFMPSPPSGVGTWHSIKRNFTHHDPRVRGLTRGFIPAPPSGVNACCPSTRPRVRGLTSGFIPSPPSGVRMPLASTHHRAARSFGKANSTIVAEPGGTAQNAFAPPVATATYCLPLIAYVTTPPFILPPVLNR